MPITQSKCQYKPRDAAFLGLSLTAELLCSFGGDSVGVVVEYVIALFLPRPLPDKLPTTQASAAFSPSYTPHDNAISPHCQLIKACCTHHILTTTVLIPMSVNFEFLD